MIRHMFPSTLGKFAIGIVGYSRSSLLLPFDFHGLEVTLFFVLKQLKISNKINMYRASSNRFIIFLSCLCRPVSFGICHCGPFKMY